MKNISKFSNGLFEDIEVNEGSMMLVNVVIMPGLFVDFDVVNPSF